MAAQPYKTIVGVVLIVLGILTTGCSSAGSSTATKKAGGASAGRSPSASTSQPGGDGGGDFCAALRKTLNGVSAAFPKDFSNPAQLKRYGEYIKSSNATLVSKAPTEIAADVKYQARIGDALADIYARGGKPTLADTQPLRSTEHQAAAKRVSAYATSHCGITASSVPTG